MAWLVRFYVWTGPMNDMQPVDHLIKDSINRVNRQDTQG